MAGHLHKFVYEIDEMPNDEFMQWVAYHAYVSPIGEIRGDYRAGVVASLLYNINRKHGTRQSSPMDFFKFVPPTKEEREANIIRAISALSGIQIKRVSDAC